MQDMISELWLQTHIAISFQYDILYVLLYITWKLQLINGCSAYQMTALLSKIFLVWFRVAWEVWLESYSLRHASQSFSDTTLPCVYCKSVHNLTYNFAWQQNSHSLLVKQCTTHQTTALLPMIHHFIHKNKVLHNDLQAAAIHSIYLCIAVSFQLQ